MARLTLGYMRTQTRLPQLIGYCLEDVVDLAEAINAAQQRLVMCGEGGEQGWWGGWARMRFNVLRSDPYITLGRYGTRLMDVGVCTRIAGIQNEFYEFLEFGNGLLPKTSCTNNTARAADCAPAQILDRGEYPTFRDIATTGSRRIRVRPVDPLDGSGNYRTLIQGTDPFDNIIYSQNGSSRVTGQYVNIVDPFADLPTLLNTLTGIQKDVTNGQIQYYDVDPTTGDETLILTMEPSETVAGYRRYYLSGLPVSCCPVVRDASGTPTAQVEAIVKLALLPLAVDSDYLLIQNAEAIIAECQSARYSTMDLPNAKVMAQSAHKDAVRFLQGELAHHLGTDKPAVGFFPFRTARLEKQAIGTLM